jgi:hypothetical protein
MGIDTEPKETRTMSKILIAISLLGLTTPAFAQTNCTQTDVGNGTVLTNCNVQGRTVMRCITFTLNDGRVVTNCN